MLELLSRLHAHMLSVINRKIGKTSGWTLYAYPGSLNVDEATEDGRSWYTMSEGLDPPLLSLKM